MFDMGLISLDTVTDFMDTCDKNEEKLLRKATVAGARIVLKAAKANCDKFKYNPSYDKKKTYLGTYRFIGNLKKSLKVRVIKPKVQGKQLVLVGPEVGKKSKNDGYYGKWVEEGHKIVHAVGSHISKWRMYKGNNVSITDYEVIKTEFGDSKTKAHPILRPAYDENVDKAYQKLAEVYNENWGETVIKDIDDMTDILIDSVLGGD